MKKILFVMLALSLLLIPPLQASDLNDNLDSGYATGRSQLDEYNRLIDARNDILALEREEVTFTVADFIVNDGSSIGLLSTSTTPGLEIDNSIPACVWADGETTPVSVSYRVPTGYDTAGGLSFYVWADDSDTTTRCQIDFNVYVNKNGTVIWDSAASDQTPVALTELAGTPEAVLLTVGTDFASLVAGDLVTLNIWRDDVSSATGDLEAYLITARRTS